MNILKTLEYHQHEFRTLSEPAQKALAEVMAALAVTAEPQKKKAKKKARKKKA